MIMQQIDGYRPFLQPMQPIIPAPADGPMPHAVLPQRAPPQQGGMAPNAGPGGGIMEMIGKLGGGGGAAGAAGAGGGGGGNMEMIMNLAKMFLV